MPDKLIYRAALFLLALYAALSYRTIGTWRHDIDVWCHAASVAPDKPRPVLNCASVLMAAGYKEEGLQLISRAELLLQQSHVKPWDREDGYVQIAKVRGLTFR